MQIKEFQKGILEVFREMDKLPNRTEHTKQSAMIHLMEEVGEIARHLTNEYHRPEKFKKEELGSELADTLMFIVVLAKLYEINLSKEMEESIERVKKKIEKFSNS